MLLWPVLFLPNVASAMLSSFNRRPSTFLISFNKSRLFKKEYLDEAHAFYQKHGGKSIVIGRFIPFIRTFVPFAAGIGSMDYRRFMIYNVIGGVLWVGAFLSAGYLFGNVPIVKDNLSLVLIAIIVITLAPVAVKALYSIKRK